MGLLNLDNSKSHFSLLVQPTKLYRLVENHTDDNFPTGLHYYIDFKTVHGTRYKWTRKPSHRTKEALCAAANRAGETHQSQPK